MENGQNGLHGAALRPISCATFYVPTRHSTNPTLHEPRKTQHERAREEGQTAGKEFGAREAPTVNEGPSTAAAAAPVAPNTTTPHIVSSSPAFLNS